MPILRMLGGDRGRCRNVSSLGRPPRDRPRKGVLRNRSSRDAGGASRWRWDLLRNTRRRRGLIIPVRSATEIWDLPDKGRIPLYHGPFENRTRRLPEETSPPSRAKRFERTPGDLRARIAEFKTSNIAFLRRRRRHGARIEVGGRRDDTGRHDHPRPVRRHPVPGRATSPSPTAGGAGAGRCLLLKRFRRSTTFCKSKKARPTTPLAPGSALLACVPMCSGPRRAQGSRSPHGRGPALQTGFGLDGPLTRPEVDDTARSPNLAPRLAHLRAGCPR